MPIAPTALVPHPDNCLGGDGIPQQLCPIRVTLCGTHQRPIRRGERQRFADIFQLRQAVLSRRYQDFGSDYFDRTKRNRFHMLQ